MLLVNIVPDRVANQLTLKELEDILAQAIDIERRSASRVHTLRLTFALTNLKHVILELKSYLKERQDEFDKVAKRVRPSYPTAEASPEVETAPSSRDQSATGDRASLEGEATQRQAGTGSQGQSASAASPDDAGNDDGVYNAGIFGAAAEPIKHLAPQTIANANFESDLAILKLKEPDTNWITRSRTRPRLIEGYDGYPCTCVDSCSDDCKGLCGCQACHTAYQDYLSSDYE